MSDKLTIRTNNVPRPVLSWMELTRKERETEFDYIVELWFCEDCLLCAVNDDTTGIDDEAREKEVRRAVVQHREASPNFESETGEGIDEFSARSCDCCGTRLAGSRHRFADFEKAYSSSFIRYKGRAYDLGDFMTWSSGVTPQMQEAGFTKWDGYQGDSFSSGVLVRYCKPDCESVVMATYFG